MDIFRSVCPTLLNPCCSGTQGPQINSSGSEFKVPQQRATSFSQPNLGGIVDQRSAASSSGQGRNDQSIPYEQLLDAHKLFQEKKIKGTIYDATKRPNEYPILAQKRNIFLRCFEALQRLSESSHDLNINVSKQIKSEEVNTDCLTDRPSPVFNIMKYFQQMWSFYEETGKGKKDPKHVTLLLNSDTSLREKKGGFDSKCFGGVLASGAGQAEGMGCLLPQIAQLQCAIQNGKVEDLGVVGIVKNLVPVLWKVTPRQGQVEKREMKLDPNDVMSTEDSQRIRCDALQFVAPYLDKAGTDTIDSLRILFTRLKAAFDLSETEEIVIAGLPGSSIFKNDPTLSAACVILAAKAANKTVKIFDTRNFEVTSAQSFIETNVDGSKSYEMILQELLASQQDGLDQIKQQI